MRTFVSIIVCTRDRVGELRQTLDAIERSCHDDTYSVELIIIDNASTDETAELVNKFRSPRLTVRYFYEARKGKAVCLNRALLEVRGDIILLTDDDVRPHPEWIRTMCAPIAAGTADAVAGGIRMAAHLHRNWMLGFHRVFLVSTETLDPDSMETLIGANCAFSRNVLERVPGFDPELGPGALGYCEDNLFALQLLKSGYRLIALFDCPATHHFDPLRLSRRSFIQRADAEGRSTAYIAHHWEYREIQFPFLRLCAAFVRLRLKKILLGTKWPHREGIAEWEFSSRRRLAFRRQYLRERHRVRHYGQGTARESLSKSLRVDRNISDSNQTVDEARASGLPLPT